jgi:hypothetical protein
MQRVFAFRGNGDEDIRTISKWRTSVILVELAIVEFVSPCPKGAKPSSPRRFCNNGFSQVMAWPLSMDVLFASVVRVDLFFQGPSSTPLHKIYDGETTGSTSGLINALIEAVYHFNPQLCKYGIFQSQPGGKYYCHGEEERG